MWQHHCIESVVKIWRYLNDLIISFINYVTNVAVMYLITESQRVLTELRHQKFQPSTYAAISRWWQCKLIGIFDVGYWQLFVLKTFVLLFVEFAGTNFWLKPFMPWRWANKLFISHYLSTKNKQMKNEFRTYLWKPINGMHGDFIICIYRMWLISFPIKFQFYTQ